MGIINLNNECAIIITDTNKMIDKYDRLVNSNSFILNKKIKDEIKSYNESPLNRRYNNIKTEKYDQVISTNNREEYLHKITPTNSTSTTVKFNYKSHSINKMISVLEKAKILYKRYTRLFNYYIRKLIYFTEFDSVYLMTDISFNNTGLINSSNNYYIVGDCVVDTTKFYKKNFLLELLLDLQGTCLKLLNQVIPYNIKSNKTIGDFEVKVKKFGAGNKLENDMRLYEISYYMISRVQDILYAYYNIKTNFKEIKLTLK